MQDEAQFPVETGIYGLRREALSPMETLAQSVSTIAPTTTPAATIPLVCALAGNGTWLAYVLATAAILLVALCIGKFARYSASPGSLYTYASMILPPSLGATAAWSLLLAYVATGASVIGGFYHYGNLLLRRRDGPRHFGGAVGDFCGGDFDLDRVARRKDFRALDAMDRSGFGVVYLDRGDVPSSCATAGIWTGSNCDCAV